MASDDMIIGRNLSVDIVKYLRSKKGKTLKQIGKSAELSESFLSRVAKGERTFRLSHLVKLEKSLGKPLPLLLLEATDKTLLDEDMQKLYGSLWRSLRHPE